MMKQLLGAQRLSLAEHGIDIKIAQRAVDSVQLLDAIGRSTDKNVTSRIYRQA